MHYVGQFNEDALRVPSIYEKHSRGYRSFPVVNHTHGSVHMGVNLNQLDPGGVIAPHVHSFEESFYILEGEALVSVEDRCRALGPGHYSLISTKLKHAWRNVGKTPVRWLEMQSPQPRPLDSAPDTFFVGGEAAAEGSPPDANDPADQFFRHFDEAQLPRPGAPAEMEGFNPTTGVAIKMFVDRSFGAVHQSLFLIQYMPGAQIGLHDHTFEESYFIMSGEVETECDGKIYRLGPGSIVWTSVGCLHRFTNVGSEPVRWLETQAPLPPAQEVFRFQAEWEKEYTE